MSTLIEQSAELIHKPLAKKPDFFELAGNVENVLKLLSFPDIYKMAAVNKELHRIVFNFLFQVLFPQRKIPLLFSDGYNFKQVYDSAFYRNHSDDLRIVLSKFNRELPFEALYSSIVGRADEILKAALACSQEILKAGPQLLEFFLKTEGVNYLDLKDFEKIHLLSKRALELARKAPYMPAPFVWNADKFIQYRQNVRPFEVIWKNTKYLIYPEYAMQKFFGRKSDGFFFDLLEKENAQTTKQRQPNKLSDAQKHTMVYQKLAKVLLTNRKLMTRKAIVLRNGVLGSFPPKYTFIVFNTTSADSNDYRPAFFVKCVKSETRADDFNMEFRVLDPKRHGDERYFEITDDDGKTNFWNYNRRYKGERHSLRSFLENPMLGQPIAGSENPDTGECQYHESHFLRNGDRLISIKGAAFDRIFMGEESGLSKDDRKQLAKGDLEKNVCFYTEALFAFYPEKEPAINPSMNPVPMDVDHLNGSPANQLPQQSVIAPQEMSQEMIQVQLAQLVQHLSPDQIMVHMQTLISKLQVSQVQPPQLMQSVQQPQNLQKKQPVQLVKPQLQRAEKTLPPQSAMKQPQRTQKPSSAIQPIPNRQSSQADTLRQIRLLQAQSQMVSRQTSGLPQQPLQPVMRQISPLQGLQGQVMMQPTQQNNLPVGSVPVSQLFMQQRGAGLRLFTNPTSHQGSNIQQQNVQQSLPNSNISQQAFGMQQMNTTIAYSQDEDMSSSDNEMIGFGNR
jgi:hypothetical protein